MKILCTLLVCWLVLSGQLVAQHTLFFTNGHSGQASVIEFKAKTVLIRSFDNPRAPLQEVPKSNIKRIVLADGAVLTTTEISQRQSSADQVILFVKEEANRVAADDGSPRPVAYEWSNFLGRGITLVSARNDPKNTILTFIRRRNSLAGNRFIISSATYLYNRQDIRQAFRIVNAGKFDLDRPITIPAGVDSLRYDLYFERVTPGLEEINFKSLPIAAGTLGGPAGGYQISRLSIKNLLTSRLENETTLPALAFGTSKLHCITCGDLGIVRCPNCLGEGMVMTTNQRVTCPVCQRSGHYLCPNRPNHPELP